MTLYSTQSFMSLESLYVVFFFFLSLNATFLLIVFNYLIKSTFAVDSHLVVHYICHADCLK